MNRPLLPQGTRRSAAFFLPVVAVLLSLAGSGAGCTRAAETRSGTPTTETVPLAMQDQRHRYVQASIEIACLTRRETDPNRVAELTLAIYRRHGFDDVMSYLALVQTLGNEKSVQQELVEGAKSCP